MGVGVGMAGDAHGARGGGGAGPLGAFLGGASRPGVLVLDGGLATECEARGADLGSPAASGLWSAALLRDDAGVALLEDVARAYYAAGADVCVSASYQCPPPRPGDPEDVRAARERMLDASAAAVVRARDAFWREATAAATSPPAASHSPSPSAVPSRLPSSLGDRAIGRRLRPLAAGSIGPYGACLGDGSEYRGDYAARMTAADLADWHAPRARRLAAAPGLDLLACETMPSAKEAVAVASLLASLGRPFFVSFQARRGPRDGAPLVADGTPLGAAAAAVADAGAPWLCGLGVNCVAPDACAALVAALAPVCDAHGGLACLAYPNLGDAFDGTGWVPGSAPHAADPAAWAAHVADAACARGATGIGGCCRTGPQHIRALRDHLDARFKADDVVGRAPPSFASPLALVRETTARVAAEASLVAIDEARLEDLARQLASSPAVVTAPHAAAAAAAAGRSAAAGGVLDLGALWDGWEGVHFFDAGDPETTVAYQLVVSSLNFCFWPAPGLEYEHLARGLARVAREDPRALVDPARLRAVTAATLRSWIQAGQGSAGAAAVLPEAEERARLVREVGEGLILSGHGSALRMVEACRGSAAALVAELTRWFPGFRDAAIHGGRQVFFYKRAQIFCGDLYGAYRGRGPGNFHDVALLTCFADYRLPQVLRHAGVLRYADGLAATVDAAAADPLDALGPGEVEIRACTVQAVERLRDRLSSLLGDSDALAIQVDWLLWERGEAARDTLPPHHRVHTIFY